MNKRFLLIFISFIFLGLVIIGLRWAMGDHKSEEDPKVGCVNFFEKLSYDYYSGDNILLNSNSGTLKWTFRSSKSDKIIERFIGESGSVSIDSIGLLEVEVSNDEGCVENFNIKINSKVKEEEPAETVNVKISGPTRTTVGKRVSFKAIGGASTGYKWNFGDAAGTHSRQMDATHKYSKEGRFTVSLKYNNELVDQKIITVTKASSTTTTTTGRTTGSTSGGTASSTKQAEKVSKIIKQLIAMGDESEPTYNGRRAFELQSAFVDDKCCDDLVIEVNGEPMGEIEFRRSLGPGKELGYKLDNVKVEYNRRTRCYSKYIITGKFN